MTFTVGVFRAQFPEFADSVVYPDAMLIFWAELAEMQVPSTIWKNAWQKGVSLYVAHEAVLAAQNAKASVVGGTPGGSGGIANSKTVGSVSVSYDATSTTEKDAGYWNLTTYGKQFIRLARLFGAGCRQL